MDLQQLRYFLEIARTENITKTSEMIHVAQPALSQTLSRLENELGVKLFDRVGRNIHLNSNGRLLVTRAQDALLILDNVKRELSDFEDLFRRTIHLQILVGSSILPDLISQFRCKYPDIQFQLSQMNPDDEYDFCITTSINGVMPESSRLLLEEEILLAVPINHPLADQKSIILSDMREASFLSLDHNKPLRQTTDVFCNAAGFIPHIVLETDNPSTLRDLIATGLGVAFIPSVTWQAVKLMPAISLLHIARPYCQRRLFISWNHERYLTKEEHLFLDFAQGYFDDLKRKIN